MRPRLRKTAEYDLRILEAMTRVLADEGWPALSARHVAQIAGVSQQAVQDRYRDRTLLACGAWLGGAGEHLATSLRTLLHAHGLLGAPLDPPAIPAAWRTFAVPEAPLRAALELILSTPYDAPLRDAVAGSLGDDVATYLAHDDRSTPRRLATQRAFLIGRALGLVLVGSIADLAAVDMAPTESALVAALAIAARPGRFTPPPLPFTMSGPPLDTGNERRDALMNAVLVVVARFGFHDATVQAIAAEAGVTKDVLLSTYPSKAALFLEATRHRLERALPANGAWIEALTRRYGPGRGESAYLRAAMHPSVAADRNVTREELRLTMRSDELGAGFRAFHERFAEVAGSVTPRTLGYSYGTRALGEGISLLLPLLAPDAWELPFEIVMIPLGAELERRTGTYHEA